MQLSLLTLKLLMVYGNVIVKIGLIKEKMVVKKYHLPLSLQDIVMNGIVFQAISKLVIFVVRKMLC